jgi:hypothetical protein
VTGVQTCALPISTSRSTPAQNEAFSRFHALRLVGTTQPRSAK